MQSWSTQDDQAVVITRALAMDAVQKVGNGHPGTANVSSSSCLHIISTNS